MGGFFVEQRFNSFKYPTETIIASDKSFVFLTALILCNEIKSISAIFSWRKVDTDKYYRWKLKGTS